MVTFATFAGMKLGTFLLIAIAICLVHGDAPVVSSQYSSYLPPAETYSHSHYNAPSQTQYGAPANKGGYATLPTAKPTYGVPSPSYGPPASSYGAPTKDTGGYDSLRDFATAPESAFIQRRLFNTSVALTVPLFSFTLPQRASQGSTVDLANQVRSHWKWFVRGWDFHFILFILGNIRTL